MISLAERNAKLSIVSSRMQSFIVLHVCSLLTILSSCLCSNNQRKQQTIYITKLLGNPKMRSSTPLRAVWTASKPDADTSMSYNEISSAGRSIKREIGKDPLKDDYEECLKRLYGKYVELEVLLPKSQGGAPPSLVYRVPITTGSVNPFGMVSKSRATVTLYPKGRTLASPTAGDSGANDVKKDMAIPVGLANVHVPLGPGLVDPSWVRGKKLFWKGRSVGLI